MIKKLIVFILLSGFILTLGEFWKSYAEPQISAKLAVEQLNGGDAALMNMRLFERNKRIVGFLELTSIGILGYWLLIRGDKKENKTNS